MIPVTKPFLPPIEEYNKIVYGIYQRRWLTNNGPLVNELEAKLKEYLNLSNVLYLGNGTIALQIAIKAFELRGEIITTPFSYVATTSSIVWEGCKPVFVDIDESTLNIDPSKIEAAVNENTCAILATHVYGNPCDIDAIQKIADKFGLKVIYDAAHCFGSTYKGKSVFEYGDISTTSFHATKVFHTIEGGAVFAKDDAVLRRLGFLRNFGHNGTEAFDGLGINGKNSEFHAGMGLCNLSYIDEILATRKSQSAFYDELLQNSGLRKPAITADSEYNFSYYPLIFPDESSLLKTIQSLNKNDIYPRRYFYPSLDSLNYVTAEQPCTIANDISKRIICLPMYHDLTSEEQGKVVAVILAVLNDTV